MKLTRLGHPKLLHFFLKVHFIVVTLQCLVSSVHQSESAICVHVPSLFWTSSPFRSPQSPSRVSCDLQQVLSLVIYLICTINSACMSQSPNSSSSVLPTLCPCVCPLHQISIPAPGLGSSVLFF